MKPYAFLVDGDIRPLAIRPRKRLGHRGWWGTASRHAIVVRNVQLHLPQVAEEQPARRKEGVHGHKLIIGHESAIPEAVEARMHVVQERPVKNPHVGHVTFHRWALMVGPLLTELRERLMGCIEARFSAQTEAQRF